MKAFIKEGAGAGMFKKREEKEFEIFVVLAVLAVFVGVGGLFVLKSESFTGVVTGVQYEKEEDADNWNSGFDEDKRNINLFMEGKEKWTI